MLRFMTAFITVLATAALSAHVTVSPKESAAGASQRYIVRVPTEGAVATTAVTLDIPDGVVVTDVPKGDGFTAVAKREGTRTVTITWTRDIKPHEAAEFVFVAVNPASPGEVRWKAHQRFADGTTTDWVGTTGERRPASVTRIIAAK